MTLFLTFAYGLIFGSFLNVLIYRLPRGENIAYPPSHCTSCNTKLKPRDLIPVFSFLFLGGKCRYCGEKIHWCYPVTEIVNALGWMTIIYYYGLSARGVAGCFLFSLALVIGQIDLEHYLIPDSLVITLLAGGVVYHFFSQEMGILNRILGLAVGFAIPFLLAVVSRGGMGGGDIKLTAAMGFWLGFPGVFYALFVGALVGSITGILLIALKRKKRRDPIPFGPFLVLGFLVIFFFRDQFVQWYWNLF
ncbi:MAG: prepilin peptidase [Bacillota bacterium]|uniref:Prepilin leader peptidase/N-methyltransferase n=1 Tax=Thermanaerosceptrum fracticalcis TaxID=1712410 RepID=A0A7G6E0A6_THEFR|nr:A24 family peptidase [Thermanaerosceptrum fracticalcis]QNB45510.1 prepilin peptidase [Thermanaerosceptrum fracticalcis]